MDGQKPEENQSSSPTQFAPGDTIRPQQTNEASSINLPPANSSIPESQQLPRPSVVTASTTQSPAVNSPEPQPPVAETVPAAAPVQAEGTPEPSFFSAQTPQPVASAASGAQAVSWTASEYISHSKNSGWYALVLLGSCVGAVLIWLVTKDILSAVVVVFAGALFATYAARQPRQLSYQLDPSGLTIGQRHYTYNEFRSFSVVPEGAFSSIVFTPLKRFGMLTTIYYDPQDEDQIIEVISQRLPHEEHRPDAIDSVMRRIRF